MVVKFGMQLAYIQSKVTFSTFNLMTSAASLQQPCALPRSAPGGCSPWAQSTAPGRSHPTGCVGGKPWSRSWRRRRRQTPASTPNRRGEPPTRQKLCKIMTPFYSLTERPGRGGETACVGSSGSTRSCTAPRGPAGEICETFKFCVREKKNYH